MLCGVWDGNQFSECGKIQSSKCQPTLMHIALSHLPESIEAPESHSLQKLTWEQPVNIVMSLGYEPTHMCHVTCTWESWWWCVGAVREGRNCGSLFAPCGGAEWWLVSRSLGGTDHLPLAILHSSSPQFPEQHRYRRWSNMVQWIIFSR